MKRALFVMLAACGAPAAEAPAVEAPVAVEVPAPSASVDRRPLVFTKPAAKTPEPARGTAQLTNRAIIVNAPIVFATASTKLLPESDAALDAVRDVMLANPSITIEVTVHTDDLGAAAYNLALSAGRANAVTQAIVARGIDSSRVTARGAGQSEPLVPNDSAEHRALNRRTEFVRTDK